MYIHYQDFSIDILLASYTAIFNLLRDIDDLVFSPSSSLGKEQLLNNLDDQSSLKASNEIDNEYIEKLINNSQNDLDMPLILADMHLLLKDKEIGIDEKLLTIKEYDKILGFSMFQMIFEYLHVFDVFQKDTIEKRNIARKEKNYTASDELRIVLEKSGVEVLDTKEGPKYYRK